ncbi:MAG: peptide chain release factor 2 [Deltaproteobacteria bacterium]|nr:peptide chain release factor 2 [Deltaproteobacteria bacterium]
MGQWEEQIKSLEKRIESIRGYFDLAERHKRLQELEHMLAAPDFWKDPRQAQTVTREHKALEGLVKQWSALNRDVEDCHVLLELAEESGADQAVEEELERTIEGLTKKVKALEFQKMLGGENDSNNAIVSINAGAGGTEAQDWASMLLRMYLRWAEKRGFSAAVIDELEGEEAGIKSATFTVNGEYAFGYLKAEVGIHRLVRISPFDAGARRHTSFASVFVYPDIEDIIEITIEDKDLRVDTYRASGAGGQHVNKTDSAVRITHIPSGIVVQCQNERSQHMNRAMAMKLLKARLYEMELQAREKEIESINATKKQIAWGNQIRSYVLQPYRLAKDHRTGFETGNVDAVLDGDLDDFIEAFLMQ